MNPTIILPDEMVGEIDDRRHSTVSRSQWIREAIQARLNAEDCDEWTIPEMDNSRQEADA